MATSEQISVNRCRHDIIADILGLLENGPLSRTRVLLGAGVSHAMTPRFEKAVIENHLITITKDGKWALAQPGFDFLKKYREVAA